MSLKEEIQEMIDKFHHRIEGDQELRREMKGINRRVFIDLGSESYSFVLEDGKVHSLTEGAIENPDIAVISDPETLRALIARKMKPMKALALRKVKVKGDMEDLLRFRKFF